MLYHQLNKIVIEVISFSAVEAEMLKNEGFATA